MRTVARNIKLSIGFISGILSLIYFLGPVFASIDILSNYFAWTLDYDLFIISGGIYGGTLLYLTGTIWPYMIQGVLFLIGWFVLYKLIMIGYIAVKEK
ncbi:MAG: hypothetical protein AB1304_11740 [Bacteroidota bacterium]